MTNDDFEWDAAKAAQNYKKHGIGFETAIRVFDDAFAIERLDEREDYGEDRYSILGMVDAPLRCAGRGGAAVVEEAVDPPFDPLDPGAVVGMGPACRKCRRHDRERERDGDEEDDSFHARKRPGCP